MISQKDLNDQLKKIKFNPSGWGRSEVHELCNILMPDEQVEECVNGYYEAGFALLVATKDRVLLVDKKPLNYLTVEDMRFDMISEFDYSHRLVGAHASISSGSKTLEFNSFNQPRLRSLITYVQTRMTEIKKTIHEQQENQQQHLEQMNEQLRQYLMSAQQQSMQQQQATAHNHMQTMPPQSQAPTPVAVQEQPVTSRSSFEHAAAVSMGFLDQTQPAAASQSGDESQLPSVAASDVNRTPGRSKIVVTPQQIGLAAARRVVPIITAYSRVPMISTRQRFAPKHS